MQLAWLVRPKSCGGKNAEKRHGANAEVAAKVRSENNDDEKKDANLPLFLDDAPKRRENVVSVCRTSTDVIDCQRSY